MKPLRPSKAADAAFVRALTEIAARIAQPLAVADRAALPVIMFLAGGAAVHLYTGARATDDVDAVFSTRVMLPEDLDVYYVNTQGENRLLYFDRQYNDTLGLVHEDAREDAIPLTMLGIDPRVLDIRVLTPLDLAVSKIGRFEGRDRDDIAALARARLIESAAVRRRATDALAGYVGSVERVRTSIELACRLVDANSTAAVKSARGSRVKKRSR